MSRLSDLLHDANTDNPSARRLQASETVLRTIRVLLDE
jgi:hypothetical protein